MTTNEKWAVGVGVVAIGGGLALYFLWWKKRPSESRPIASAARGGALTPGNAIAMAGGAAVAQLGKAGGEAVSNWLREQLG